MWPHPTHLQTLRVRLPEPHSPARRQQKSGKPTGPRRCPRWLGSAGEQTGWRSDACKSAAGTLRAPTALPPLPPPAALRRLRVRRQPSSPRLSLSPQLAAPPPRRAHHALQPAGRGAAGRGAGRHAARAAAARLRVPAPGRAGAPAARAHAAAGPAGARGQWWRLGQAYRLRREGMQERAYQPIYGVHSYLRQRLCPLSASPRAPLPACLPLAPDIPLFHLGGAPAAGHGPHEPALSK